MSNYLHHYKAKYKELYLHVYRVIWKWLFILCPMLAYQPCLQAFWVLKSLHLLSFLLKMFFIILVFIDFFLNDVNVFLQIAEILYIIMKSCNQKCIKICSSMKVSLLYLCIDYHSLSLTDDLHSLFHLQHCLQKQCQSLCQPFSTSMLITVYNIIIQWL